MRKVLRREIKLKNTGLLILSDGKNGIRMLELRGTVRRGERKNGIYRVSDPDTGAFGYAEAGNAGLAAAKFGFKSGRKVKVIKLRGNYI